MIDTAHERRKPCTRLYSTLAPTLSTPMVYAPSLARSRCSDSPSSRRGAPADGKSRLCRWRLARWLVRSPARLTHLLVEPDRAAKLLNFYGLLQPGTPGNIIGLMLGGFAGGLAMRRSLELPSAGNFYAPALAAASVIWRVGCTLASCCYGKPTDMPWAIYEDGAYRHPTMVYEGLFNLMVDVRRYITRSRLIIRYFDAASCPNITTISASLATPSGGGPARSSAPSSSARRRLVRGLPRMS